MARPRDRATRARDARSNCRRPSVNLQEWRDYVDRIETTPLEAMLQGASPAVRAALEKSLERKELTPDEGLLLYTCEGDDLRAMVKCADLARAEDVGNEV